MTNSERLAIMKDKLNRLENSSKDIKCPGVVQKIRRQIRHLEKSLN